MVKRKHTKDAFWQALVFTVFIFGIGLMSGLFMESSRLSEVEISAINSEIDLLDAELRNEVMASFDVECDSAISSTFEFADKIYTDASNLESFDEQSSLIDTFKSIHRRYDLLRTLLWIESVDLKEKCGAEFHTVVYLYDYEPDSVEQEARQDLYASVTGELKNGQDNVLLIPIAVNLDISSLDLIIAEYSLEKFPVIIIDETYVIDGLITIKDLEEVII